MALTEEDLKREKIELWEIRKALKPLGYFVWGASKGLGTGITEIYVREYNPKYHDKALESPFCE